MKIILVLSLTLTFLIMTQFQHKADAQLLQSRGEVICRSMDISHLSVVSKRYGGVVVLGIITNNSTKTHENVGVAGEFYDSNNKLIGVESSLAELSVLAPGDRTPFKIETDISNQTLDHYTILCGSSGRQPG